MFDTHRLRLNDPGAMQIELRLVGDDKNPLLIVDNFFADPEYVRNTALGLHWLTPTGGDAYPGRLARATFDRSPIETFVLERIARDVWGLDLDKFEQRRPGRHDKEDWSTKYQTDWVFCRMEAGVNDRSANLPHWDTVMLAAIVYLNLPHQCREGTAFFRHRETGIQSYVEAGSRVPIAYVEQLSGIPFAKQYRDRVLPKLPRRAWSSPEEIDMILFGPGKDLAGGDKFERLEAVEMKFNRLVAYPGWQFHGFDSKIKDFGTTGDAQRLSLQLLIDYLMPRG